MEKEACTPALQTCLLDLTAGHVHSMIACTCPMTNVDIVKISFNSEQISVAASEKHFTRLREEQAAARSPA